MKLGVIFPQTEIGSDPGAIREFAQAAEELGYHHILVYDHVLGADPDKHPDWGGAYTMHSAFHEPFVLFGYLAGLTSTINLTTGIIILPQRQTVLVAKQAAAIDVLSNGRMRLGVGLGWNRVEYEALGEDFRTRGRRVEEQVALLRALWTDESVDFSGQLPHGHRRGPQPDARAAAHPHLDGWRSRAGAAPSGRAGRRLASTISARRGGPSAVGADVGLRPRSWPRPGGHRDLHAHQPRPHDRGRVGDGHCGVEGNGRDAA